MIRVVRLLVSALRSAFLSQSELAMENLALRQQLAVLVAKGQRPRIGGVDRWFGVTLRRFWSRWSDVLIIVKPETVGWRRQLASYAPGTIELDLDTVASSPETAAEVIALFDALQG
jgi:hypothetical protein